ncbi:MAG: AMP-binding protein, partial [Chroococcidiopsidaceae cyanobacterium CP_BM_RX_35]|nr:AMP-binding protein [Chroococcidiopsidaceae cyanobacterium CP_BM_RX_35]
MAEVTTLNTSEEEVFIFPVSFAQQRLWFLEQLVPGNPFYNVPTAVRLSGPLNLSALEQTFNEIVRRHEALRTTFRMVEGQLVQILAPELNIPLPIVDLQHLPATIQEQEAQRLTAQAAQQPFDLALGPLLRVQLLQLGETEYVLLLTMHHIVSDGWSIGVLIRELGVLYAALTNHQPSPLAALPIQYADFAQWQRQWLQGEVLATQLAYWQQQLDNLPVLELPTDRPRPAVQSYRGATQYLELSLDLTQALESLSEAEGVTLFMTLLAAFQTLLYRYTGQTDIAVGSPIANRNRSEIEGLIGFFVNSLVMRTDLAGNPSFRELLSRAREVVLGAYAHQDLPFEKLVEELQPERHLSHMPLFQVMFALQSAPTPALDFVGLNLEFSEIENKTAKFDLTLSVENTEQGLKGSWEYNTDLFDSATITRMLSHFQTLLEGIVANPEQQITALPLLTKAEKQQLLITWNNTQVDYPQDQCIHQRFETQVEQTPHTIAIASATERLTYQELNHRANQLAHCLQKLGVGPEVLVCLCMERSVEMIVALLGILKAGGAYLPLDPTYPQERLNFILEDAQVPILLTQQRCFGHLKQWRTQEVIYLDKDREMLAQQSQENPISNVTASNLAYAIYTSGSTGQPKGVQVQHSSLLNLVFWHQKAFEVSPTTRATQIAAPAFDACGWEIW